MSSSESSELTRCLQFRKPSHMCLSAKLAGSSGIEKAAARYRCLTKAAGVGQLETMTETGFLPITLESSTRAQLAVRHRAALGTARGVIQINHGLAEHAARYERFADFLAARGYHTYAHDHRGHGLTKAPDAPPGQFAASNGVDKVIEDVAAIHRSIAVDHPGLPVICFGHSMGGLIALNFAEAHPEDLAGLAVWNANFNGGPLGRVAQAILAFETMLLGSDVPSRILPKLTFQAWGKAVPNHRTLFDWLSRDEAEVQAYINDPLCGWDANVSLWKDTFELIYGGPKGLSKLPRNLPIQLVGGEKDPATDGGKALQWLSNKMKNTGFSDIELTILVGTRHESLNEINRKNAMSLFADWADRVTA